MGGSREGGKKQKPKYYNGYLIKKTKRLFKSVWGHVNNPVATHTHTQTHFFSLSFSHGIFVFFSNFFWGFFQFQYIYTSFRAILDEGGFGLVDSQSPIELYTQVLDAETLNIVHMHINDIHDVRFPQKKVNGWWWWWWWWW